MFKSIKDFFNIVGYAKEKCERYLESKYIDATLVIDKQMAKHIVNIDDFFDDHIKNGEKKWQEEYDEALLAYLTSLNNKKTELLDKLDTEDMEPLIKKCIFEYLDTKHVKTSPQEIREEPQMVAMRNRYNLEFIKVASVTGKAEEKVHGGDQNECRRIATQLAKEGSLNKAMSAAVEIGSEIGASLVYLNSEKTREDSWFGTKVNGQAGRCSKCSTVANVTFYKITGEKPEKTKRTRKRS